MTEGTWLDEAKKNSGLLIFLGVLTVILGVLAIGTPFIAGVAVSVWVGILVGAAGVLRIVHAVKSGQWGVGIWGTIVGVLMVFAGIILFARPAVGVMSLTILLAIYLVVEGLSEIFVAFKMKPDRGWGWMLFGGFIAFILGVMIWRQFPMSGAWAIGTLFGIHVMITGWEMIIIGGGARSIAGTIEDAVEDSVDYADGAVDRAGDMAGDAVDKVKDLADDAVEVAGDAVDKAKDFAGDVVDKAEDVVEGAVDKAKDAFDGDKK